MLLSELKVFHGTGAKPGVKLRPPIFVALDRDTAEWYAVERAAPGKGKIWVGDLDVKNTLDLVRGDVDDFLAIATRAGIEYIQDPYFQCNEIQKYSDYDGSNYLDIVYIPRFVKQLKKEGYDSIKAYDVLGNYEPVVYVFFDSSKFKVTSIEDPEGDE